METVDRILDLCRTLQSKAASELELQNALEILLSENFRSVTREARLGGRDIVDFMVEHVALEVKVKGSPMSVIRQLQRYASHEEVAAIVLVTTRASHRSIPMTLHEKPLRVAWLNPF